MTGANVYLIGGVVCIVCVFYTLVVSWVFILFLVNSIQIVDTFSGRHQSCGANGCVASDCYVYIGCRLYGNGHVPYRRLWSCILTSSRRWSNPIFQVRQSDHHPLNRICSFKFDFVFFCRFLQFRSIDVSAAHLLECNDWWLHILDII